MIPEKLKKIDECLIQLLRERMSILADCGLPSLEQQLSSAAPLLAQLGVPESVWANVLMGCFAALNAEFSSSLNNIRPRRITIIGGRGRMGKLFTQQLSAAGHNVSVLEHEDWEYADTLLGKAELVLVCVPIEWTVDVIKRATRYLTPNCALADITSMKAQPVQAMLEYHSGPVMGLHPMFGPQIKSFSGQKFVFCPGRNDDSFEWFLNFIESKGGELIVSTPEEHDQIMVIVQAVRIFSRFSFGVFLAEEGVDVERSLSMSSPNYRIEMDIVKRLFAQDPRLCVDIILATEDRCQAIESLAKTYSRLAELVAQKDRAALIQEFEATRIFFAEAEDIVRPLKESDYVLNALPS